jgi:alkanesulfonate monooxygenase SsuD/methylene tetrahydromethanopterin reductase-like flavin-dependent oxidoreductase (luciferase family)
VRSRTNPTTSPTSVKRSAPRCSRTRASATTRSSGLFGTPERCLAQLARLRAIDVDEIACLIDFGVPADEVLASLPLLDQVRASARRNCARPRPPATRPRWPR